jgi:hypothetical protein
MNRRTHLHRQLSSAGGILAALALATGGLTACSTTRPSAEEARPSVAAPTLPTPLATSAQTSGGSWATIPMGRLDQPVNTFWQLLFRRAGATSWSNQVKATATATNGGLVLASSGRRWLTVGVRPSIDLTFTPLISTSDAARSWSTGLITAGLAARPDALAVDADGQALALANKRGTTEVLSSTGDLSTWRLLVSQGALANVGRGQSCELGALTAVGYLRGRALVGGSCGRPGVVGLFAQRNGGWHLAGPALPRSLEQGRVEVLALGATTRATSALLAVLGGAKPTLVAAWSGPGARWRTSPPLPLVDGESISSFGPSNGDALFVLLQAPSGQDRLMVSETSSGWQELPSPPSGTETVAFADGGPVDALVATSTVLTIWSLAPRSNSWAKGQVIHVPVQLGSSS